jgi:hypothetical protein
MRCACALDAGEDSRHGEGLWWRRYRVS